MQVTRRAKLVSPYRCMQIKIKINLFLDTDYRLIISLNSFNYGACHVLSKTIACPFDHLIITFKAIFFPFVYEVNQQKISFLYQARPLFKDRRKFPQMADPMLQGQYPTRGLYQALAVAAMCVQEQPTMRPLIADVVTALTYLASQNYSPENQAVHNFSRLPSMGTPPTRRDSEKRTLGGSERGLK